MPTGIVALIAPQVALLGPETFSVLALFAYAFLTTSIMLLSVSDALAPLGSGLI